MRQLDSFKSIRNQFIEVVITNEKMRKRQADFVHISPVLTKFLTGHLGYGERIALEKQYETH